MVMAFISIVIVLAVLSPKQTGSEVFQTFGSNLGSTGALELFSAQVLLFYSLVGSDSTAHMAEETQHAPTVIPRAMVASYAIMGVMNLVVSIVYSFCWVDPTAYLSTTTGYPFLAVFESTTGSAEGALTLASIQIVLIVLGVTSFMASTSRQVFAFARDDGLPFGEWVAKVNPRTGSPLNSLLVVFFFVVLISLIGLGSTVAFNAIVSLQIMALAGTYEVSIICLIWRRLRGKPLPSCPWTLGRLGLPMNIAGAVYGLYLLVYSAMPGVYPVTAADFNWAPVIFGGVMILSLLCYFVWARRAYQGLVVHVSQD